MTYSAMAVANAFISRSKKKHWLPTSNRLRDLTPRKLQKLMYFAQVWQLTLQDTPLMDDFFVRWLYGPVIPSLFHATKRYGNDTITHHIKWWVQERNKEYSQYSIVGKNDTYLWELLDRVIDVYGVYSSEQLRYLVSNPDSAWAKGKPDGGPITNAELIAHGRYLQQAAVSV